MKPAGVSPPRPERPWLVGDIGGTNVRFGLVEHRRGRPARTMTLPCAHYPDLATAVEDYLRRSAGAAPSAACVAVAGPVEGDRIRLTNASWDCSAEASRLRLGLDHLDVLNDFAALALALPMLEGPDLLRVGGPEPPADPRPLAVLGPGTGLGVAGLLPTPRGRVPVTSEGGHSDAPAVTERELRITERLRSEQGHVSAESLLSGPGLVRLHRGLAQMRGAPAPELTPAQICAAPDDPRCAETLEAFCGLLGGFAGNVALTLGATGGVFLGGGILPRIADSLLRSPFRVRFEDKGPMSDYVRSIPTSLIVAETPALIGATARLDQILEHP